MVPTPTLVFTPKVTVKSKGTLLRRVMAQRDAANLAVSASAGALPRLRGAHRVSQREVSHLGGMGCLPMLMTLYDSRFTGLCIGVAGYSPAISRPSRTNSLMALRISTHWADKAEALASYARQSQDDELLKMAQRIKARAIRRADAALLPSLQDGVANALLSKVGRFAACTALVGERPNADVLPNVR